MSAEMNDRFDKYYVRTDDIEALKRELGALAALHAELPITITGTDEGEVTTRVVAFRVSEVSGEGGFIGRGTIAPHGTEAMIREMRTENGSEYLEMDANLNDSPDGAE